MTESDTQLHLQREEELLMYLLWSDREKGSAAWFAVVTPSLMKGRPIRSKSASCCLLVGNGGISGMKGTDSDP